MNRIRCAAAFAVVSVALVACAAQRSWGSGSASDADDETVYVPERAQPTGELLVPPDVIVSPFAVRCATLACLRAAVADLQREVRRADPDAALRIHGIRLGSGTSAPASLPVVDGDVVVPITAGADAWQRGELLVRLDGIRIAVTARPRKDGATLVMSHPQARVADPEHHRAALLARWATWTAELAATRPKGSTVALVPCATPTLVQQEPLSSEEVALTLAIDCPLPVTARD